MGAISKMAKRCRECPDRDTCQNKRMELCGYYDEPIRAPTKTALTMVPGASVFNEENTTNRTVVIDPVTITTSPHDNLVRVLAEEYESARRCGVLCNF